MRSQIITKLTQAAEKINKYVHNEGAGKEEEVKRLREEFGKKVLFAFTNLKIEALMFLSVCAFLLIPINLSKKNRMYKVVILLFNYLFRGKEYCFFKGEIKESKIKTLSKYIK